MKKPLNKELNPKLLFSFIAMINGLVTLGVSIYLSIGSTIIVGLIIFLVGLGAFFYFLDWIHYDKWYYCMGTDLPMSCSSDNRLLSTTYKKEKVRLAGFYLHFYKNIFG